MVDLPAHDGERLTALMDRRGTTDAALAEATEVSVQAVGKWRKTGKIARQHLSTICATVGCTSDELLRIIPIGAGLAVHESRATYSFDRQRMRNAVEWTMEGLSQSTKKRSPEATADLVIAVHDMLAESEGQVSRSVVLQMIRSAA